MPVTLHVCTTCRAGLPVTEGVPVPGARLAAAIGELPVPDGVTLRGVECLSTCSRGCAVALTATGRWSYVYGNLTESDAPEILRGAAQYAAAPDGIPPWRDRPAIFRKNCIARIPPIGG